MKLGFGLVLSILFMLLAISILPCGVIWSINTLFRLHIEYSFENIIAMFLLLSVISPHLKFSK